MCGVIRLFVSIEMILVTVLAGAAGVDISAVSSVHACIAAAAQHRDSLYHRKMIVFSFSLSRLAGHTTRPRG